MKYCVYIMSHESCDVDKRWIWSVINGHWCHCVKSKHVYTICMVYIMIKHDCTVYDIHKDQSCLYYVYDMHNDQSCLYYVYGIHNDQKWLCHAYINDHDMCILYVLVYLMIKHDCTICMVYIMINHDCTIYAWYT